ncbi:hypothetical protein J6590_087798 [Homalodisca vitripennis]|nr:hypothetical protein J6590_087798 [Homalodisca vitripennis]
MSPTEVNIEISISMETTVEIVYSKFTLIAALRRTTEQGTHYEAQREDQDLQPPSLLPVSITRGSVFVQAPSLLPVSITRVCFLGRYPSLLPVSITRVGFFGQIPYPTARVNHEGEFCLGRYPSFCQCQSRGEVLFGLIP